MRIRVELERPSPRHLQPAIDALRKDSVIIYPTDSGYAFGCALSSHKGMDLLRKLKGYGEKHPKPLTMIVADITELGRYGQMGNQAFRLVRRLLPGAYTIVLPATKDTPRQMKNRWHEVGMRLPVHAVCKMLVEELGEPLLTGSVTPADAPELEDPEELERRYTRDVALVIDVGMLWPDPSTVLRLVDDRVEVIREGKGPVPE